MLLQLLHVTKSRMNFLKTCAHHSGPHCVKYPRDGTPLAERPRREPRSLQHIRCRDQTWTGLPAHTQNIYMYLSAACHDTAALHTDRIVIHAGCLPIARETSTQFATFVLIPFPLHRAASRLEGNAPRNPHGRTGLRFWTGPRVS